MTIYCTIHDAALIGTGTALYCPVCKDALTQPWSDKPDQFSERVKSAHPVLSKDADKHARYALAMEMIHSRHSKYGLVDLVNWLLTKWPELQAEATR